MVETFQDRLKDVRKRVQDACVRAGREPDSVAIMAAAKTRKPEEVREAAENGLTVMGENRVQEAKQKIPLCPGNVDWHMIGHLQRNKVRDAVRLFRMIHSIDSWKLLETVNDACASAGGVMSVCLEVNVSGESSKYGLAPEEVSGLLMKCGTLMNVDVVGLMTIPPVTKDPEGARPYFKRLCELRNEWRESSGFSLDELSMGMSNDFEVAVEEGATWIRLGTVLFGERERA